MQRRTLLKLASGVAVTTAGCIASDETEPGGTDENDDDGEISFDDTTVATFCAGPEDDWVVALGDDELILEGTTPAPNPCHEIVLEEASLSEEQLDVEIGVVDTLEEGEECIQCHGGVHYTVECAVGPESVESVSVGHEQGEMHTPRVMELDAYPAVEETSIETDETSCGTEEDDGISVSESPTGVLIEGELPAPNPCHEAVLRNVKLDGRELIVEVGVDSTLEAGEGCVECLGRIEYEALVSFKDPTRLERVTVDHENAQTHSTG